MRYSTLCYIERDGKYLMLHRVRKKNDVNRDKWIGVGGGMLEGESPEECVCREAREETGLTLCAPVLRSVVTFVMEGDEGEIMFLFKCADFSGTLSDCDEGVLEWIPREALYGLDLWEGDRIFLKKIENPGEFFTLKLEYARDGRLLKAVENGTRGLIPERKDS